MFLLDHGADAKASMDGVGALHAASGAGKLLALGLEPETRRRKQLPDRSRFRLARSRSRHALTVVKALLAHGADPNQRIDHSTMFFRYIGYPTKGAFESFACGTGDSPRRDPAVVAAYAANGGSAGGRGRAGRDSARMESTSESSSLCWLPALI